MNEIHTHIAMVDTQENSAFYPVTTYTSAAYIPELISANLLSDEQARHHLFPQQVVGKFEGDSPHM